MWITGHNIREFSSWLLVLCAVVTTLIVVRQQIMRSTTTTTEGVTSQRQATYIDHWEEVLASGIRLGSESAPVQLVEFADFECPGCARYEATLRVIRQSHSDKVAFTFAHLPLDYHSFAEAAARAANCAHEQGRFDEMRGMLFENSGHFGSITWVEIAKLSGVPDILQFEACVIATETSKSIVEAKVLAEKIAVKGTPTLIVNGWMLPIPPSLEQFDQIVRNVTDGKPPAQGLDFSTSSILN